MPLVLLGLGLFLLFAVTRKASGSISPPPVSSQVYFGTKAGIQTAVQADVTRLYGAMAPPASTYDAWLDQLTQAWLRGNVAELQGIATDLAARGYSATAQASNSRIAQLGLARAAA